ncbi:hypothetical protein G6011_01296 [Alternaria panax]|uniref:F-box domain-containing protein n=1 Tax=Alternaria panax TaxID=48097 RepID=A0AAD4IKJ3_9PLEO|nr:hypothetical protein G6011_01296 [Alternaria panax]
MLDKPFRFLDLPAELQYIVYEQIEISTCHCRLKDLAFEYKFEEETTPASYMTLIVKTLPVELLATCHLIYEEAAPVLASKLETLRDEPSQFIIDSAGLRNFVYRRHSIGTMLQKQYFDR